MGSAQNQNKMGKKSSYRNVEKERTVKWANISEVMKMATQRQIRDHDRGNRKEFEAEIEKWT